MLSYTAKIAAFSLRELLKPRLAPTDAAIMEGRAWPWLCDYMLHINNAEYLALMDYGRTQYFVRLGLLRPMKNQGFSGVVAGTQITYRRSIDLLRPYRMETRLLYFDERWYYHEQTIYNERDELAVRAIVRCMLRDRTGPVSFGRILAAAGHPVPELQRPPLVDAFDASAQHALQLVP